MPIYEYKCNSCNAEFELLIYTGEEPVCPKCLSKNLTKKISKVSFKSSLSDSSSSGSSCSSCSSGSCSSCR
ncbi:MAG: zinc ribbon domain-containing protein [Endomicrobiia bacterium]